MLILVKELNFTHIIKNVDKKPNRTRKLYRNVSRLMSFEKKKQKYAHIR